METTLGVMAIRPHSRRRTALRTSASLSILLFSTAVRGAVVISNVPATVDGGTTVNTTDWKALLFTSGSSAGRMDTIELGLNPPAGGNLPNSFSVQVSLYDISAGLPSSLVASTPLSSVSMSATRQLYSLTGVTSFDLAPNTSYALVVASDAVGVRWANRTGFTPTASGGFQYDGFLGTSDAGSSWTSSVGTANVMQIAFSAIPEPGSIKAAAGAALLAAAACHRCRTSHPPSPRGG